MSSGTKSSWHLITTAFFSNSFRGCHCSPSPLMNWRMGCNEPLQVCMEKWGPQETQKYLSVEVQERLETPLCETQGVSQNTCFLLLTFNR